jgi:hypothetical protein
LNADATLSADTADRLNALIDKGLIFSIATARTEATVVPMLSRLKLKLPVVLMNGAAVYNIAEKKYELVNTIGKENSKIIAEKAEQYGINGFCYRIADNKLNTFLDKLSTKAMIDFYNERVKQYNKKFTMTDSLMSVADENTVYFCFMNTRDKLEKLYTDLKELDSVKTEFYADIYDQNNWFLEILNKNASKKSGVLFVKQFANADKAIGFGDNLNDMPLFDACDECYAVANAKPELKAAATGVIGENVNNGVVSFLEKNTLN